MWFVIQTQSGYELDVRNYLEGSRTGNDYGRCFVPLYEEVRNRRGKNHILFRRMFPGYLFVEADNPFKVLKVLRQMPGFTRILGSEDDDGQRLYIPIGLEDEEFLGTLLEDGVMHVSYVKTLKHSSVIEKVTGPLAKYRNHIVRLDKKQREAIVQVDMFGKRRKIRFGLWLEGDPELAWLASKKAQEPEETLDDDKVIDIGLKPGDIVADTSGIYEGYTFIVEKINPRQRRIKAKVNILGGSWNVDLFVDQVEKVAIKDADGGDK